MRTNWLAASWFVASAHTPCQWGKKLLTLAGGLCEDDLILICHTIKWLYHILWYFIKILAITSSWRVQAYSSNAFGNNQRNLVRVGIAYHYILHHDCSFSNFGFDVSSNKFTLLFTGKVFFTGFLFSQFQYLRLCRAWDCGTRARDHFEKCFGISGCP